MYRYDKIMSCMVLRGCNLHTKLCIDIYMGSGGFKGVIPGVGILLLLILDKILPKFFPNQWITSDA